MKVIFSCDLTNLVKTPSDRQCFQCFIKLIMRGSSLVTIGNKCQWIKSVQQNMVCTCGNVLDNKLSVFHVTFFLVKISCDLELTLDPEVSVVIGYGSLRMRT